MSREHLARKRELRQRYVEELLETLPTMSILPLPEVILDGLKQHGGIVVGGRGTGKTNLAKVITSQIIGGENGNIQIKIADSAQNWVHGYEPIYYQHLNMDTEFPEDIYFGDDHFLYDLEFWDVDEIQDIIGTLVATDYDIQRLYKKENLMDTWIIWCIEEAQNVLGTYAMNGARGKRWLKIISESRNFNINFLFVGQRLADISTKAVERSDGYFFGKTTGDNDLKKIKRICGKDSGVHEMVPTLDVGEFIYWNGAEAYKLVDVPLYVPTTRPTLWRNGMGI